MTWWNRGLSQVPVSGVVAQGFRVFNMVDGLGKGIGSIHVLCDFFCTRTSLFL